MQNSNRVVNYIILNITEQADLLLVKVKIHSFEIFSFALKSAAFRVIFHSLKLFEEIIGISGLSSILCLSVLSRRSSDGLILRGQ